MTKSEARSMRFVMRSMLRRWRNDEETMKDFGIVMTDLHAADSESEIVRNLQTAMVHAEEIIVGLTNFIDDKTVTAPGSKGNAP